MATGKGNKYLLVIVIVAIIVIILAVAIPSYHTSQVHKHLNAALDEAASAKLVVEEAATVHGGVSQLTADDIHWNQQTTGDKYVAGIRILDGGRIQVTTRDTGSNPDPVLLLTPALKTGSAAIEWHCSVVHGNTSTLPDGCSAPDETGGAPAASASAPATSASAPASGASAAQPGSSPGK